MQIARIRLGTARGGRRTSTAIIRGDRVALVSGAPHGRRTPSGETATLAGVQLLAPARPGKVVAIGINYRSHAGDRPPPAQPEPFLKAASSVIGPGEAIVIPRGAGRVDAEAEVVAVIGRRARNIAPDDVDRYVLGYTCGNDVSARDWQRDDLQWWRAKSSDTFTAVGPWIETGLDPERISLVGRLNGREVQRATTAELVHPIRACIARISSAMTLEPGDLVFTGTPGSTAELHAGDVFEVEVEGAGVLSNPVIAAP